MMIFVTYRVYVRQGYQKLVKSLFTRTIFPKQKSQYKYVLLTLISYSYHL